MNLKKLIIPIAAIACALAVSSARAAVTNTFVFSATTFSQSQTNSSNGTNTSFGKISSSSHSTAQLIEELGHATSQNFSKTAKLVLILGGGPNAFQVIDGANTVDVSAFLNIETGENDITAGIENGQTGLAFPTTTEDQIVTLQYDDTGVLGDTNGLKFTLTGLGTVTTTDGVPNQGGTYTQTFKATVIDMTGEGSSGNSGVAVPFVASGKITVSGKGTQTIVH